MLTEEQEDSIQSLSAWFRSFNNTSKPYKTLSGPAGVGKTYTIAALLDNLGLQDYQYISCAYTGKAVVNLIQNGLKACTIHSLIYDVVTTLEPYYYNDKKKYKRKVNFVLKESLDENIKLIIVDEATMVNDNMSAEILSFKIPVIFVGDVNQLPPIFGTSSVMAEPDYWLTKIMRQKEGDPIIYLSQRVLHDEPLEVGIYGNSSVVSEFELDRGLVYNFDQIITATNNTRDDINDFVRYEIYNRNTNLPVMNDKVMCRHNNWGIEKNGIYLTNGLIGNITCIDKSNSHKGYYTIDFLPTFMDEDFEDIMLDLKYISSDYETRKRFGMSRYEKFEYAYAVTCHSMQGSAANNVLYIDKRYWDREYLKKLRYTAITRARESITFVIDY
jgi:exodeoxyribonuclease-5